MSRHTRYCIIGATGAVGREALAILASRGVPAGNIVAAASARSVGSTVDYLGATLPVVLATPEVAKDCHVTLMCASADVSRQLAKPI
ncbi:MAG: hypothetical protein WC718_08250, partial [Phycisphaerales bacterium]